MLIQLNAEASFISCILWYLIALSKDRSHAAVESIDP